MGVALAIIAVTFIIIFGYFIYSQSQLLRLIEETPTSPIGKVTGGLTEIKGDIVSIDEPIISPLTKKPCVYLRLVIEELRSSGKNSRWVTIKSKLLTRRFHLDDGTGQAVIELEKAQIDFEVDNHRSCGMLNNAPPDFEDLLKRFGLSSQGLMFNNNYRCSETILEEGDRLYVLGEPNTKGDLPFFDGSLGDVFFVSDKSEEELTNELVWKVFAECMMLVVLLCLGYFFYTNVQ